MSHDHDHDAPDVAELRYKYQRVLELAEHMRHVIVGLKELVPKAFEEGFRSRMPDAPEPWLVDWLQSDAKKQLDIMLPRPPRPEPAAD
ncbi:MAG: hypothetical protein U1F43_03050 [Myxococcota bacterium]